MRYRSHTFFRLTDVRPLVWRFVQRTSRYASPKEGKEAMFNPIILIAFSALILYFILENLQARSESQNSHC
jgi:hypothetical protein